MARGRTPNPPDEADASGGGAASAGGRSGTGSSWGTGGLNFDTKGIDDFAAAVSKAADAVERFWAPFKDTSQAKRQTDDFVNHFKASTRDLGKGGVPALGSGGVGGGGGQAHPTLAGNSRMPARPQTVAQVMRQQGSRFLYGAPRSDETEGFIGRYRLGRIAGDEGIVRAGLAGVASGFRNQSAGMKAAEGAAAFAVVTGAAHRYTQANLPASQQLQSAANTIAFTQSPQNQNWSTGYRDTIRANLGQQGWGFTGRSDIAQAATIAQQAGISAISTSLGGSPNMSPAMQQAGLLAGMQGTTASQQMSAAASMRAPSTVNMMLAYGINIQPGGKQQDQTQIYKQLRDLIYAPLGRTPTKAEVQATLRTPGNRGLLLAQTMLPDADALESFIKWVENSASQGSDVTTVGQAQKAPGAQTQAAGAARRTESVERTKSRADEGLLREQGQVAGVIEDFNNALGDVLDKMGPFGSALQDFTGYMIGAGGTAHGIIPHVGGGGGGGLGGQALHLGEDILLGRGAASIFSRGGGPAAAAEAGAAAPAAAEAGAAAAAAGEAGSASIAGLGVAAVPLIAGAEIWSSWKSGQKVNRQVDANVRAQLPGKTDDELRQWYASSAGGGGKSDSITKIIAAELRKRGIDPNSITPDDAGAAASAGGNNYIGDPRSRWGWRTGMDMGDADTTPSGASTVGLRGPGKTQGMDSGFLTKLGQMFTDNPRLVLNSGFRTRAEQERLFKEKPGLAAPPGSSLHEKGKAADIGPRSEYAWIAQNYAKYGLTLPMPSKEPWHVQPDGASASSGGASVGSSGAIGAQDAPPSQGMGAGAAAAAGGGLSGPNIFAMADYKPLQGSVGGVPALRGLTTDKAAGTGQTSGSAATPVNADPSQSDVMATILRVGRSMGADPQMLLAAFETGWDESHMTNLHGGDRDSQGVFQQRPSQGWGTVEQVTNVEHAAHSFFSRAAGSKYRGKGTAAQMAQDVQRSATADGSNYQKFRDQAVGSLSGLGVNVADIGDPVGATGGGVNVKGGNVTIQNATFIAQIARGTPEEAENFARTVMNILQNRDRLLKIAGGV